MLFTLLKKLSIPSNISTYLSRTLIIITVATTFLIGGVLIIQQTFYFKNLSQQKSSEFIENQKVYIQEIVKNELEYIRLQNLAFKQRINNKIKLNVDQAINTAESIYKKYAGIKSEEEIKSLIVATISSLKFNMEFEEVFISTMDGFGVFYPRKPAFAGKDMRNFKDANGSPVVLEEINLLGKNEEGFIEYPINSGAGSKALPNKKITFVKKFGHYNWYFGSKQYVDDFFPKFTEEIAQKISTVRFRNGGYVFMSQTDGTPIVLDGKIYKGKLNLLLDSGSPHQKVFEQELEVARNNPDGGFLYYKWNKINETNLSDKCSFTQLFPEYNWMIGAGFYLDEVEKSIKGQQDILWRDQQRSIVIVVLILMGLLFMEALIIYHFNKSYKADFDRFFRFFYLSPNSFDQLNVGEFYFDEFKKAGSAANEMIVLRKEVNNKLIEEQKRAAESDRLKSAFLANMSHEIRTPMNSILGFSELLDEETRDDADKSVYVKLIRKNGEILLNLINDIVDLSKIEANLLTIKKRPFSLNRFLDEIEKHYSETIAARKDKQIQFAVNKLVGDLTIKTDEIRLRQIMDNLIGNSIKFTSSGAISVEVSVTENMVHFGVSDTGIGIAPDQLSSVFERFIQADHGGNAINFGGTGLGLAISKNLAELLGGSIGVESERGKGSRFYFSVKAG